MVGSTTLALFLFAVGPAEGEPGVGAPALLTLEQNAGGDHEEIQKLRAELRLPGPEARQKRESAVAALLGMKAPQAHQVLQEVLQTGADPDGLVPSILAQLGPRLRNERDPVFGAAGAEGVQQVRRGYVRPMVLLASGQHDRPPAVTDPARDILRAFASWERVPVFRAMLAGADRAERLAAARAAGLCQDLSLARELGAVLADPDPDVRSAVAASLERLTFRRGGFGTKAELDAWFERLGDKSFVELADEAARRGLDELEAARQQGRDALRDVVLELIASYVQRQQVRWKEIQRHVLASEPVDLTVDCLKRLRTLLAGTDQLTGSATDRLAFFAELHQRLAAAEQAKNTEAHALLLEVCAYLCVPGEPQSEEIVKQLRSGLRSDSSRVRQAALIGLRPHPSDENRGEVVAAVRAALASGDLDVLRAALGTLHANRDWYAPLPDDEQQSHGRAEWLAALHDTIRRHDLPLDVRQEALRILDLRDGNKARVLEGFPILVSVVEDRAQDGAFRERALIQVEAYVVDAVRGSRYVQLLETSLADPAPEVRSRAAQRIDQLPAAAGKEKMEAWTQRLLEVGRTRLLEETDPAIHGKLVESMRRTAEQRVTPQHVISQLCIAVEELAAAPADRRQPFRRKNLSDALRILASHQDLKIDQWVRAGEALLALGERDAVRSVLAQREQNHVHAAPAVEPGIAQRALLLTLRTALQRVGSATPWSDPAHAAEAQAVLDAVAALQQAKALPADPAVTLLQMEIRGDRQQHQAVVALADSLPQNGANMLDAASRHRAALLAARSHLALGQPAEARDRLLGLTRNGTVPDDVLALLQGVAEAFFERREFAESEQVGAVLVARTPESSPACAARLLLHARAQYQADPATNAAAVRDRLESKRALFTREDTPAQLRQQFETLLARIRDDSNG